MKQAILLIGISGSGKTDWAQEYKADLEKRGENVILISRDALRERVFADMTSRVHFRWHEWDKRWNERVEELFRYDIEYCATHQNMIDVVIVDDTNLDEKEREYIIRKLEGAEYNVRFRMFPCDFYEAVKRDVKRPRPVGSHVIAEQIEKYWEQFGERYEPDFDKPKAVIVDMDGTICFANNRSIYDWEKIHSDDACSFVSEIACGLNKNGVKVLILSGRDDGSIPPSKEWFENNVGFEPEGFFFRSSKDGRPDAVFKHEAFFNLIAPNYNVIGVIEDRPKVVRMWHSIGVRVLAAGFQSKEF